MTDSSGGATAIVDAADLLAERLLPLEGGRNFRDLGGYPTIDGRSVRWRRVYRSGSMTRLTPADHAFLDERGIRLVIDLRTRMEREAEPNAWCEAAGIDYWAREYEASFGELQRTMDLKITDTAQARAAMAAGFRALPFEQAQSYTELVRRIAAGAVPLVFNCTAGKDRTGTAAAILLSLLGVPRETVIADFRLTDRAVDLRRAFRPDAKSALNPFVGLDHEVVAAILSADPSYVAAALDAIDERCGSTEDYARDVLGINGEELERMRGALLE